MQLTTLEMQSSAMTVLEQTSRTFFIPISRMPDGLKEATASAYLCMRAIDEIEDHAGLKNQEKAALLGKISLALQGFSYEPNADVAKALSSVLRPYERVLPEVSLRLGEWCAHAPAPIAPRIISDTIAMADRMKHWASVNWRIGSQADLDAYTYSVAAAVGLLVCDVAAWYDGTSLDRSAAIHFGRGLQVTNIARNRPEDISRGVDFYPPGWTDLDIRNYAAHWLRLASDYAATLPEAPFTHFIKIPLALAEATLDVLANGQIKLTREAVISIIGA
jgi:farnesyl-diphosphate farnesyltransferase